MLRGRRYRPSIRQRPTESNLQHARTRLRDIKLRIRAGTFSFTDEFPDFRDLDSVVDASEVRTCGQVFDEFLAHISALVSRHELSPTTHTGYRRILESTWRPHLGALQFRRVDFSTLNNIASKQKTWNKKTYNNISALRRAFKFGYRNHPGEFNPALALQPARRGYRDSQRPDPFRIYDAETLISAIHRDWGEAQGNFDELRFFTGLRPSEQIALTVTDYDVQHRTLRITKARVHGVDINCTKTRQDRLIELNPRAASVLNRQLTLRERLRREGLIDHQFLFFHQSGEPILDLDQTERRWRSTLTKLPIRYRRPYVARHTSVSWNLMIGKSALKVARQHGHSPATMWRVYSAWTEGAVDPDIEAIRRAMNGEPQLPKGVDAARDLSIRISAAVVEFVFATTRCVTACACVAQAIRERAKRVALCVLARLSLDLPLEARSRRLSD